MLTIRFTLNGRFFERGKMSENRQKTFFFVASAFRPVWPGRCDLSFICIPQSTRALDQGRVEPRQAVSPKALRENCQKTLKTGGFWRFFRVRSNPLRESGCQMLKTGFFLRFFFWSGASLSGKTRSSVKNWVFFAFLGVPKLF